MKRVNKSVLIWYSPREMYELVTAVEDYPRFLPWCHASEVLDRGDAALTARLHLNYMGVRHAFTTRNVHVDGRSVTMALLDGPFSMLDGTWLFEPLGRPGGDAAACKVLFDLRYAFANPALEALISPAFDRIANTFVDSFVKRAESVYGPR